MTLQPFTPVDPDRAVGNPNPPGDMNNTALQLLALGSSDSVMNAAYSGGAGVSGAVSATRAGTSAGGAAVNLTMEIHVPSTGILPADFWTQFQAGVRAKGGDPRIVVKKVVFA